MHCLTPSEEEYPENDNPEDEDKRDNDDLIQSHFAWDGGEELDWVGQVGEVCPAAHGEGVAGVGDEPGQQGGLGGRVQNRQHRVVGRVHRAVHQLQPPEPGANRTYNK